MKKEEYDRYVERWNKYWEREKIYWETRRKWVKEEDKHSEAEFERLDKDFGHDGFNALQFGPYTIIEDPADLLNPAFILPGFNIPFCEMKNTDHNIPSYFGKTLKSELTGEVGTVVAYGYDSHDDYIIIEMEDGKKSSIIVNSHYVVLPG